MPTRDELKEMDIVLSSDLFSLSTESEVRIDAKKAQIIADTLREYPGILRLELIQTQIDDEGITIIAEALKLNTTLTYLNLMNNNFEHKGITALVEAIMPNKTLLKLDLTGNHLGLEKAQAVSELLKGNNTLRHLDLSYNLESEDVVTIAEALTKNHTINSLDLMGTVIEVKGLVALKEAMKLNKTLTNIILDLNQPGIEPKEEEKEDLAVINKSLERNKQFVKKVADFLVEKFITKKADVAAEKTASDPSIFKHYQVADKVLLQDYIEESVNNIDPQENKVMSLSQVSKTADAFINKHYFSLAAVCKTHENQEDFISSMPEHIREHIVSFMGDRSLWAAEE